VRGRWLLLSILAWGLLASACSSPAATQPTTTKRAPATTPSGPMASPSSSPKAIAAKAVVSPTQELAAVLVAQEARSRPDARSAPINLVPAKTPITEERTVLPVLAAKGAWLKVRLPGRPNGHSGWITRSGTSLSITKWHLLLDLSRRELMVYRKARRVRSFKAVIGKPSTPTPKGDFFVEESLALPATDVGAPYALALSARSDVFQEFAGGPGQIAIHGLDNIGGVPGTAVSHGCVRLATRAIHWLAFHIAPGTPVTIKG
jgi:L,D-transpeptidase catalytic domain